MGKVSALVSGSWLRQQMVNGLKNIRILDGKDMRGKYSCQHSIFSASWRMSGDGRVDFLAERIAGAQHFDIDEVADKTSPYPHMVPSETEFQDHVGKVSGQ